MKRFLALLVTLTMLISLSACASSNLPTEGATTPTGGATTTSDPTKTALKLASSININYCVGNNQRTITYNQTTPLKMPDGTTVMQGDLKPMWQYVSKQIGVAFKDVSVQDQKALDMMQIAAATGFKDATIYGGNSIGEELMNYGAQGYFLNLSDRLDDLPNFKAYLEANPSIKTAITAYDGGIYYIPYIAEIGNYARGYHGRESWVTGLLDSDKALEKETKTLKVAYNGYWQRQKTNVVNLQNAAAKNGELTRDMALKTLLDYIKATYPNLAKPSDLYLGDKAQYDIDELVALWRVIELSPNTLSKLSTGKVVEGAEISPYFVRQSSYREDLLKLANYFGGQRVHGTDSYNSRFYLNEKGELTFSYGEDSMIKIYDYFKQLYSEGLISSEFSDLNNKDNFRKVLYSSDGAEGQKQFGFMTFDWFASTTAANADVVAMLPPVTTVGSSKDFIHFIENTRTVKPDGWGISAAASEEEINAALTLFDYFFTEEGHVAQNYGVPSMIDQTQKFLGPDGKEYPKYNQWVTDSVNEFKNGDVSAFLRDFVGSLMPIGYQKEIGFEYQYTVNRGWDAWDTYNKAKVVTCSYGATDPLFKLIPSVFSLNEQDNAKLSNNAVGETQVDQIFLYITGSPNGPKTAADIKKLYTDSGVDTYIQVYRDAYARMAN